MNCKTDRSKLFIVLIFLNCQIVIEGEVTNEFIWGWDTQHCDKQVFEFVVCVGSIFLLHKKQPNVDGFRSRMFLSSISYQDFFSNSTPPEPYQPFYTIFPFWLRKRFPLSKDVFHFYNINFRQRFCSGTWGWKQTRSWPDHHCHQGNFFKIDHVCLKSLKICKTANFLRLTWMVELKHSSTIAVVNIWHLVSAMQDSCKKK